MLDVSGSEHFTLEEESREEKFKTKKTEDTEESKTDVESVRAAAE